MSQNLEDAGGRKFICVQINEPYDIGSEAYKAGYMNIPQVSRERLRRAGQLIKKEAEEKIAKEKGQILLKTFLKRRCLILALRLSK